MKVKFVDFGKQYKTHKTEYDRAIQKCLNGGRLILQKELEEFEHNLATKLGFKYALGVANGTDALLLVLRASQVKFGREITTSGYTFKATMEAIVHAGYKLKVVDIGEDRIMKDNGHFSLPVHIEGMVSKTLEPVVEDGAQAIGADGFGYSGTATLSFYPAKILGCFGDGGAVLTNNDEIYRRVKLLRHHWQTNKDEQYGYNSRLDNVQAAFLNVKLKYLDDILDRREEIASKYSVLGGIVGLPIYQQGRVWQDYVIRVKDPEDLSLYLADRGIQTLGVGMTPPHRALGLRVHLPNTDILYKEMIRIPCNETLTNPQVNYVIKTIKEYYEQNKKNNL